MSSVPPGAPGAAPQDAPWDAFARQAFTQWSEWMRAAAPAPATPPPADPWAWWTRMAQASAPAPQAQDLLGRFDAQARDWITQMQRVAAQFVGRDAAPADIAQAWRQAAGGAFDPLGAAFGALDPQAGMRLVMPWMQAAGGAASMPAFGFAREHQERWQTLLNAQAQAQSESADYIALMQRAWQDSFARMESRLAQRARNGQPVDTARGLFDLWIDAAEEAYAAVALSPEFRSAYGRHVDALVRLKAAVDGEAERAAAALNMPTRTEVDSAHRKIVALEREVRRLRDAVAALSPGATAQATAPQSRVAARPGKEESPSPSPATPKAGRAGAVRGADASPTSTDTRRARKAGR